MPEPEHDRISRIYYVCVRLRNILECLRIGEKRFRKKLARNAESLPGQSSRTDLPNKVLRMRLDPLNPHQGGNMRLSVLAALGITAFLGSIAIDAPNANAVVRDTSVVSSPRGTAVVTRARGATIVKGRRGTAVVSRGLRGARGAVIMRSPRSTAIVRGRRGTTIVSRMPAARAAVITSGPRSTRIVRRRPGVTIVSRTPGARGAVIVSRPRGQAIVRRRRSTM
jgi:hypothetical protein